MRNINVFRQLKHFLTFILTTFLVTIIVFTTTEPVHAKNNTKIVTHFVSTTQTDAIKPSKIKTLLKKQNTSRVNIQILNITPKTLNKDKKITLDISIDNPTQTTFYNTKLNVYFQDNTPISRENLNKEIKNKNFHNDKIVHVENIEQISPGTTKKTITLDTENLPIQTQQWGPRKISVQLIGNDDNAFSNTYDCTYIILETQTPIQKTKISIIAPITFTDNEILQASNSQTNLGIDYAKYRLNEIAKFSSIKNITLAIDPAIFDTKLKTNQSFYKNKDPKLPENNKQLNDAQKQLIKTIKDNAQNTEIIALPYANADISTLKQIKNKAFLIPDMNYTKQYFEKIFDKTPILDNVFFSEYALPRPQYLPNTTTNIITNTENVKQKPQLTYTPNGITKLDEKHSISIVDKQLSEIFTDNTISKLNKSQLLLAHSAIITRQRPNEGRQILIKLPYNYIPTSNDYDAISQLNNKNWVEILKYSDYINKPTTEHEYDIKIKNNTIPKNIEKTLPQIEKSMQLVKNLSSIIQKPNTIETTFNNLILHTFKHWENNKKRQEYLNKISENAKKISEKIKILPSKQINLINSNSDIPVTVTNTLSYPIKANLISTSSHHILQVRQNTKISIPAQGGTVSKIPVKAIANGTAQLSFTITNNQGEIINSAQPVEITVRAEWEGIGTTIIASALLLLLIFGISRAIIKNKRRMNINDENYTKTTQKN